MLVTSTLLIAPTSASAEVDPSSHETETGGALEIAGSLIGDALPVHSTHGGFVAESVASEVVIPTDPSEPLSITAHDGQEIGVDLPFVPGMGDGVLDESGAVVYESDGVPVSLASQATTDGAQLIVVIESADAPIDYEFGIDVPNGAKLIEGPGGTAEVVGREGQTIVTVHAPWAVDAHGRHLPTSYRIDGNVLVQTVDHNGATYPVIADPRISFGWGVYLYMTGFEIRIAATALAGAGGAAVVTGCSLAILDQLPIVGRAATIIKLLCGWLGIDGVRPILRGIENIVNNSTFRDNACYEWKVPGSRWKLVGRGNCSW